MTVHPGSYEPRVFVVSGQVGLKPVCVIQKPNGSLKLWLQKLDIAQICLGNMQRFFPAVKMLSFILF